MDSIAFPIALMLLGVALCSWRLMILPVVLGCIAICISCDAATCLVQGLHPQCSNLVIWRNDVGSDGPYLLKYSPRTTVAIAHCSMFVGQAIYPIFILAGSMMMSLLIAMSVDYSLFVLGRFQALCAAALEASMQHFMLDPRCQAEVTAAPPDIDPTTTAQAPESM
eukprot:361275-Amphidinium_carterae.1